ncbi:MAG: aminotransferase class V-fold PLP-dependent enzyme [Actinomycetota bacterium]
MVTGGVHLDHAAGRPLDPRVRAAMLPVLDAPPASVEGVHEPARRCADLVEEARGSVAALLGAPAEAIVFTAGATEARNLAVKGLLSANRRLGGHVVASAVEHPATLACCRTATRDRGELTLVGVDADGRIAPSAVAAAVREDTALVCVVHGQPEVGTIQDVAALVAAARDARPGCLVVVDAEETAGVLPVDVEAIGCDALVVGGGAMAAPPWTGALYVRPGTRLHPVVEGGLQEGGKRAGAQDVPGVVALGAAARLAAAEMAGRARAMTGLRDLLVARLTAVPGVRLNGARGDERLPGHVQVSVEGVEGETLALALAARDVAVSPGSACSAAGKASPVLEAMGLEPPWTHSAVLLTLDWRLTVDEVVFASSVFAEEVARLRAMSPLAR